MRSHSAKMAQGSLPMLFVQAKDQEKSIGRYLRVGGEVEKSK